MYIFCINLNKRADKWKHILTQKKYIGEIIRWEGTDGNLLDTCPDYIEPIFKRGHNDILTLSKGEWGVLDSSVRLWKYIFDNNIKQSLILEDDIILNEKLDEFLETRKDDIPADWDIILLGHGRIKSEYLKKINNNVLKFEGDWFNGAYSYLININGINKILKYLEKNKIDRPLDCFIANSSITCNLNIYKFSQILFSHKELGSNIWHCGGTNDFYTI
tara:strand:- start:32 stop:685 length:654 start_codon:yes stop_codon:yes gene_type:complete